MSVLVLIVVASLLAYGAQGLAGIQVEGLPCGRTYHLLRPWLQPVFMVWALFCVGLLPQRRAPSLAPTTA